MQGTESLRFVQNGVRDDGTPNMEPRFLERRHSAALEIPLDCAGFLNLGSSDRIRNALGDISDSSLALQTATDTLTWIRNKVIHQLFHTVDLTKYGTILQGEGAYEENILLTKEVDMSDAFEAGNIDQGTDNDRLSEVNTGIANQTIKIRKWAKGMRWTITEINQAMRRNSWDVIEARIRSRVMNYKTGIQSIFFLGSITDPTNYPGLLNNPNITVQSSLPGGFTALINTLGATPANFQAFVAAVVESYRSNCQRTVYPDYFIIPEDDFNGLGVAPSSSFPIGMTMYDYLLATFRNLCGAGFQILPSAYGIPANNAAYSGLNKHLYLLGRRDEESGFMAEPVPPITTAPGTSNNYEFQSVMFAQYTGYTVAVPRDFLAFQF